MNYSICVVSDTVQNERDIKKETLSYRTRGVILLMIQTLQLFLITSLYSLASVPGTLYGIKKAYEVYFLVPDEIIKSMNSCICDFTDPHYSFRDAVEHSQSKALAAAFFWYIKYCT